MRCILFIVGWLLVFAAVAGRSLAEDVVARSNRTGPPYPRILNCYAAGLYKGASQADIQRVARYDLLCGGVDANATAEIARVRQLNPHILILPYIILRSAEATSSDVPDAWWARDAEGHTFNYWPGSHVLNLLLPSVQDYLVKECEKLLADPHEFDGVFFDGYDQGIGYLNYSHPGDIDLDGDGKRDDHVVRDAKWRAAEQSVIRRVAALRGGTVIVMANTWTFPNWVPANLLHGVLAEDQIRRVRRGQIRLDWFLDGYQRTVANSRQPVVIGVVNGGSELNIRQYLALTHQQQAAEQAKVRANVQAMRFGLVATLMGDGYYGYDLGPHRGQHWWYPEYDSKLGYPKGPAAKEPDGTWCREFDGGTVIVNGTAAGAFAKFAKPVRDVSSGKTEKTFKVPSLDGRIFLAAGAQP